MKRYYYILACTVLLTFIFIVAQPIGAPKPTISTTRVSIARSPAAEIIESTSHSSISTETDTHANDQRKDLPSLSRDIHEDKRNGPPLNQKTLRSTLLDIFKSTSHLPEFEQTRELNKALLDLHNGDQRLVQEALELLEEKDIPQLIVAALQRNYPQTESAYSALFSRVAASTSTAYRGKLLNAVDPPSNFIYHIPGDVVALLNQDVDKYLNNPSQEGYQEALNWIVLLKRFINSDLSISHTMLGWLSLARDQKLTSSLIDSIGLSNQDSIQYELASFLSREDIPINVKSNIIAVVGSYRFLDRYSAYATVYTPILRGIVERGNENQLQKDDLGLIYEAITTLGYCQLSEDVDVYDSIIRQSKYDILKSAAVMSIGYTLKGDSAFAYLLPIITDEKMSVRVRSQAVAALNLEYRPSLKERLEGLRPYVTGDLLTRIDEVMQNPHPP